MRGVSKSGLHYLIFVYQYCWFSYCGTFQTHQPILTRPVKCIIDLISQMWVNHSHPTFGWAGGMSDGAGCSSTNCRVEFFHVMILSSLAKPGAVCKLMENLVIN